MNILKINSGKVELRKDSGALIRSIGNGDAIQADINTVAKPMLEVVVFYLLQMSFIIWVKVHHPFNSKFISKHSKIRTPRTVRNRHFNFPT